MARCNPKTTLLLQRWHQGQHDALASLLEGHLDYVHREVRRRMTPLLRARQETGDMVQEALLAFLEDAPRFDIDNGVAFRALLSRIACNTMLEEERWWRALRREWARERALQAEGGTVLDLEAPDGSPVDVASAMEAQDWICLGLELLDPRDRKILLLRYFEKKPDKAIGEFLLKSADAARMQRGRSLDKLTKIVARLSHIVGRLRRGQLGRLLEEELRPISVSAA